VGEEPHSPYLHQGPDLNPTGDQPPVASFLQPQPLQQYGLAISEDDGILICLTCGYALTPSSESVLSHLGSKHRKRKLKGDLDFQSELQACLEGFTFAPVGKVRFQPYRRSPIRGIAVKQGFYCPLIKPDGSLCEQVCGTEGSLYQHFKGAHGKDRPLDNQYGNLSCDYQSVFSGGDRHFFRVQTGLADVEGLNPYSVFLRTVGTAPPPHSKPEPIREGELPSFIRGTRWHVFLEPYRGNPRDVVRLIQNPTISAMEGMDKGDPFIEHALCVLPTVTEAWIDKVHCWWTNASGYVQRILANYPM